MNLYLAKDGQQLGPFTLADVQDQLAQGIVSSTDLAFHEGLADWQPIETVLASLGAPVAASVPPPLMAPASAGEERVSERFGHTKYLVRRKIFTFFGGAFHIFDPAGSVVLYSRLKSFKLKEDIRLYTGEDMKTEVLIIKARKILDISSAYDDLTPFGGQFKTIVRRVC